MFDPILKSVSKMHDLIKSQMWITSALIELKILLISSKL